VFEPLANSLLSAVMRAESACTASELEQVANLREACRASAERFSDLPDDDLDGFLELRTNANAYLQALQQILLKPKK
jgi:hypothetical protein